MKKNLIIFSMLLLLGPAISRAHAQNDNDIRFILVNADTDTDIGTLEWDDTIYYSNSFHITIRAEYLPAPDQVEEMKFLIQDQPFHSEYSAPYAIRGDRNGDYLPFDPGQDQYWQFITARAIRSGTGGFEQEREILLWFIDTTAVNPLAPTIDSFVLVNAETDTDIRTLIDGDDIFINRLPELNIRMEGNIPQGGSIIYSIGTDRINRTENKVPYAVYGDINGDYQEGYLGPRDYQGQGNYTTYITATPYSGPNGSGISGEPVTLTFTVHFGPRVGSRMVSVFPNPSQTQLNVSTEEPAEVLLFDLMGKVYYQEMHAPGNQETLDLDQLKIPQGIYFMKLIYADKSEKVIHLLKN